MISKILIFWCLMLLIWEWRTILRGMWTRPWMWTASGEDDLWGGVVRRLCSLCCKECVVWLRYMSFQIHALCASQQLSAARPSSDGVLPHAGLRTSRLSPKKTRKSAVRCLATGIWETDKSTKRSTDEVPVDVTTRIKRGGRGVASLMAQSQLWRNAWMVFAWVKWIYVMFVGFSKCVTSFFFFWVFETIDVR